MEKFEGAEPTPGERRFWNAVKAIEWVSAEFQHHTKLILDAGMIPRFQRNDVVRRMLISHGMIYARGKYVQLETKTGKDGIERTVGLDPMTEAVLTCYSEEGQLVPEECEKLIKLLDEKYRELNPENAGSGAPAGPDANGAVGGEGRPDAGGDGGAPQKGRRSAAKKRGGRAAKAGGGVPKGTAGAQGDEVGPAD